MNKSKAKSLEKQRAKLRRRVEVAGRKALREVMRVQVVQPSSLGELRRK